MKLYQQQNAYTKIIQDVLSSKANYVFGYKTEFFSLQSNPQNLFIL